MISPRWRDVIGTSAVGVSHKSSSAHRKLSSANFGNCPEPVRLAVLTRAGGRTSKYPFLICKSSMKFISDLSSFAACLKRVTNRLFAITEDLSLSQRFNLLAISQCSFRLFPEIASPHLLISLLSFSFLPLREFFSGMLGKQRICSFNLFEIDFSSSSIIPTCFLI